MTPRGAFSVAKLIAACGVLEREIGAELGYWQGEPRGAFEPDQAATIVRCFGAALCDIRRQIEADVEAAFLADPAARSADEILICNLETIAIPDHRYAHQPHTLGVPIVARMIAVVRGTIADRGTHPNTGCSIITTR